MITTVLGVQFPVTNKILIAPKSELVLNYLKAAKEGQGLAKEHFKSLR